MDALCGVFVITAPIGVEMIGPLKPLGAFYGLDERVSALAKQKNANFRQKSVILLTGLPIAPYHHAPGE